LNRSVFRKTFETELRTAGEADKDREFIQSIMRNPQLFKDAKSTPQPNQLLALAPGNKDVEAIYSELVKRIKGDGVLTVDAIVAATSTKDEDRKRRTEYLTVAENSANASTLEEHTTRITKRSKRLNSRLGFWAAITSVMLNIGAFFGIYAFTYVTHYVGRRAAFAVAFVLALLSTVMVFGYLTEFSQIFWMIPLMGFCQLALFGGYAIYFPELFPTHLRSTGTSFCYNVGRFVAASGPLALGYLSKYVFSGYLEPMRPAGVTMSAIFLLGLFALPFAPETKGKPLPE
jgi:hypothetical protein